MTERKGKMERIYRNLMDAGCDARTVDRCMELAGEERDLEMLPVLARHREALLDAVHMGQKRIDCLDFLIYRIKKQAVQRTEGEDSDVQS